MTVGRGRPGLRRLSRELALRLMFQHQSGQLKPEESLILFERSFDPRHDEEAALELDADAFSKAWPMAKALFLGAARRLDELDRDIEEASANWNPDRMAQVDLALIRLAYYEMRHCPDVPPLVSLNEALELSKSFGDIDSTAFVNGVLDRLLDAVPDGRP
ncbi:MAG: transcription antitermination factor NusB [Deltaproteobacteria bacterium]|nr:transcription antitermination factor NusB [Deltaproteobacteria bacterium]